MVDSETTSAEDIQVKILLVLIDGLGDLSHPDIDYKLPLEAANIPNMDAIAKAGICGIHDPVQSGLSCGSDTAHMSIFGYNPLKLYNGRGAFETMGTGIDMSFDDIAFKSNFAYINDQTGIVERRRADREFDWGIPLCDALNDLPIPGFEDYIVKCEYATEHRCGLKVNGKGLSSLITGTDPLKDGKRLLDCEPTDPEDPDSVFTAKLVNNLSDAIRKTLTDHPINQKRIAEGLPYTNCLLLRGCGQRLHVKPFSEVHAGLKPFMIAPTAIIRGAGMTFGIPIVEVEETTGYYNSNLNNKALKAVELITSPEYNYGFVHVKAVDDAGHDKSLKIKIEQLEKTDKAIGILLQQLAEKSDNKTQYIVCVTGDHTTPVHIGDHTFQPVPISISLVSNAYSELTGTSKKVTSIINLRDNVDRFDDNSCGSKESSLGRFCGSEIMSVLKKMKFKVEGILKQD